MYLNFFSLKKEPFQITPDPEFLFLSASHREALASIIYGIEKRKGFIAIIGGVGLGKTTIFRSYLERINKSQIRTIYIFNPNVSFKSLLKTIFQEMDIEPAIEDIVEMVNQLHEVLIEEYRQGHNIVLAIDEAQNIPIPTLENLRMLSNLETSKDKLIQMVLIGQPEFEEMLNQPALRQINQRIAMRSTILPLTQKESAAYIQHRLGRALTGAQPVFTDEAIKKITQRSKGIPRIINILCDNALVTAYGYQKKPVTDKIAAEIIRDFDRRSVTNPFKWRYAAVFAATLAAAGLFWIFGKDMSMLPTADRVRSSQAEIAAPVKQVEPAAQPAAPAARGSVRLPIQVKSEPALISPGPKQDPVTEKPDMKPIPPGDLGREPVSVRTIKNGDTLTRLLMERYGYVDDRLLSIVRDRNPWIRNVNKIYIGYELVLPELKRKNFVQRRGK